MKLLEFVQILNERNVANIDELKQQVTALAGRIRSLQNKNWFIKQALSYLVNKHEVASVLDPETLSYIFTTKVPDWATKASRTGDGLWLVTIDDDLMAQFGQIIDWVNSLPGDKRLNMNLEQAKQHADKWHEDFTKKIAGGGEDIENVKTIMEFPDGFKWVDLGSHACLSRESDIMGHCVGGELNPKTRMRDVDTSYWPLVEKGAVRILSLRDSKNEPHITMELGAKHDEEQVEADAVNHLALDLGLVADNDRFHELYYDKTNLRKLWDKIEAKLGADANDEYTKYYQQMMPVPGEEAPWVINQIKGKANQKPAPQYQSYLVKMINKLGLDVAKDRHHISAVKLAGKPGYLDMDELKSGGDLHFEGTLRIENKKGTYEFGDISSKYPATKKRRMHLGGRGSLEIINTDVRSVGNVHVSILELKDVPDLTFNGETVITKISGMEATPSFQIRGSKVTFGTSMKGLDYSGLIIQNSTVLNMPSFVSHTESARGRTVIESSVVEFPEYTTYMNKPDTWGSIGLSINISNSKVRLPKTLAATDRIEIYDSQVSLKSVEWLYFHSDSGMLITHGTPIDGLPENMKVMSIKTDQPDKVASLITDDMEIASIVDEKGNYRYKIKRQGDKNIVTKVDEETIRDDKGGIGHAPTVVGTQGIDAHGYGITGEPEEPKLP